jgi:hypothetical protein
MVFVLAHIAHWYFWPLYALPVLIVLWSVIATTLRERRESKGDRRRGE